MSVLTVSFQPFGKQPTNVKDMSFWVPEGYHENDFYDLARNVGGDLVEQVELIDDFVHPKHQQRSHCYRVTYRHLERSLTNAEVNVIHKQIATHVEQLGGKIR